MLLEKLLQVVIPLVILLLSIEIVPVFLLTCVSLLQRFFHAIHYLPKKTQRNLLPDQIVKDLVEHRTKLLLTLDDLLGLLLTDDRDQTGSPVGEDWDVKGINIANVLVLILL